MAVSTIVCVSSTLEADVLVVLDELPQPTNKDKAKPKLNKDDTNFFFILMFLLICFNHSFI
jgi:hypothetical protein